MLVWVHACVCGCVLTPHSHTSVEPASCPASSLALFSVDDGDEVAGIYMRALARSCPSTPVPVHVSVSVCDVCRVRVTCDVCRVTCDV